VNNSVITGYSNKAHDGFLGNSVLGEWCNLGADTNNSNLKNTYGNVQLFSYAEDAMVDSGLQFCGLIMGDHAKTGINTMLNTGTVVGVAANVFGGGFPPKHVPGFAWGGEQGFAVHEVDKALADLNGNSAAWRMSEESAIIEGFGQKVARYMVYGNEATEPEGFTGLAPRFNDQASVNGENILTSAATPDGTDNTSIWVVGWGPDTCHMIYPKGSKAGLQIMDKGHVTIENVDGSGGRMEAYRTHYKWDCGMVVRDWRYVVRINFDLEDVVASGATGPVLRDMLAKAMRRIPSLNRCRPAIYMNRDALDAFDLQMNRDPLLQFKTQEEAQGKFVTRFRGVPVRRVDQILSTEAGI
jgi:hypothetical protein